MSSLSTNAAFTGPIPYHLASRHCRNQAQLHTEELLGDRFTGLTEEHWGRIFMECRPLLWVDEANNTITVAKDALHRVIACAVFHEASLDIISTVRDGHYLARQLEYYCRLAHSLEASDPMLTNPKSIADMRAVFFRLSVGNEVSQRLSERFDLPVDMGVEER